MQNLRLKMDFEKLKPFIGEFVDFYRDELNNPSGGSLHIIIEDGNVDDGFIWNFQESCKSNGDSFGYFLMCLLRYFTEEEREMLFENYWNFLALEKNNLPG